MPTLSHSGRPFTRNHANSEAKFFRGFHVTPYVLTTAEILCETTTEGVSKLLRVFPPYSRTERRTRSVSRVAAGFYNLSALNYVHSQRLTSESRVFQHSLVIRKKNSRIYGAAVEISKYFRLFNSPTGSQTRSRNLSCRTLQTALMACLFLL